MHPKQEIPMLTQQNLYLLQDIAYWSGIYVALALYLTAMFVLCRMLIRP